MLGVIMTRLKLFCVCLASSISVLGALAGDPTSQPEAGKAVVAGWFQVRNQKYSDLLRPEEANGADGTRIVLYPAQPWKCMTWRFHANGESRFQLQNYFTSKTFAAEAGADKAQAAVTQVPFSKKSDERPTWQFTKLTDGTYKITDAKSGKALTAVKDKAESTARMVVQTWQEGDAQKWKLIEIDPKQLTM
jgi:pullulanase/glycogen debranching enzyme